MDKMHPQARMDKLTSYGYGVEVEHNVPLMRYYRSGKEMVRMAKVYQQEGHTENAFILYIKFTTLFLEKAIHHPEYKTLDPREKSKNKATLQEIFPIAEALKEQIRERYQHEYDVAVEARERNRAEAAIAASAEAALAQAAADTAAAPLVNVAVPQRRSGTASNVEPMPGPSSASSSVSVIPTAPDLLDRVLYPKDFPDPQKLLPSSPLLFPDAPPMPKPAFDRALKPTTSSDSLMEGCLRQVIIPRDTMHEFLTLALKNTKKSVETCGVLTGRLAKHRLYITHVIVPKQHGTSDSCTTTNEEEIFEIQDQLSLVTIGWIHTHPTQTAFLSSVDLHTHCSYQIMMPEAIAIVCAPKFKTTGFYCLTPDGLDYVAGCRETGFHPHPKNPPLFMDAEHICLDPTVSIEVIDLREMRRA